MNLCRQYLLLFALCFVFGKAIGFRKYYKHHYGTQELPGSSCANILKNGGYEVQDGIYWITMGSSGPFPVFCNMKAGGWTLAFKLVAGVAGCPLTMWEHPFSSYEFTLAALNLSNNFKHHYKNRIVQKWESFKPSEARVILYKDGREAMALRFNASGSDNKSWFKQENILESPWQDILTAEKYYFSIDGVCHLPACRNFYISGIHDGCPSDVGWLSVGDLDVCDWEKRLPSGVRLIYSKEATCANYNRYNQVDVADVFAVFIR